MRCAILALLAIGGEVRAQPAGDPTPGSLAPLVVIVNPMTGAVVGQAVRVQARVHHPSGSAAVTGVTLSISGAGAGSVPLLANPRYAPPGGAAIWEANVSLSVGLHALVATATDSSGRSTSSATVSVNSSAGRGDGNLLVTDDSSQLCSACHGEADHGSEVMGRSLGAWTTTCRDCHTPHATTNASLIRRSLTPPWVTGSAAPAARDVRFSTRAGYVAQGGVANPALASFANGDASGPCQVCHTRTSRWRGDGVADVDHRGNCAFCHPHRSAFKPLACTDCHAVPPATGAHLAHAGASAPRPPFPSDSRPLGCGSCHPTDQTRHGDGLKQVVLNSALTLPGGTVTAGASLYGTPTVNPSCIVACHYPMGSPRPSTGISWGLKGPLPCRSCHVKIEPNGSTISPRAGPTLHAPGFSEARPASGEPTDCFSCHDPAAHDGTHLTGAPGLLAASSVNATCVACHSPPSGPAAGPQGQVLHDGTNASTSRTPPVLPGWSAVTVDAGSGDFHGGRRGTCYDPGAGPVPCAPSATPTGYGGTLKAPYTRGQPAMPCAACHAGHASGNSFLFADVVNGTPIPAGSIDRTGIGAERLCEACHEGERHGHCKDCHTDAFICDSGQCWMDPAANHVDPAPPGTPCFWCHGHEGLLRWTQPGQSMEFPWNTSCNHCHGFGIPPTRTSPPLLTAGPQASSITATTATVRWTTDAAASSWVEYGVGMPGWVAGSGAESYDHTVTLTGLTPGTSYVWRIRTVEQFRNALETPVATFVTMAADAVPVPDLVPVGWTGVTQPASSMVLGLVWFPVTSPTGNPVQYRVQLASDASFLALTNGSPPDSGWISGAATTSGGRPALQFGVTLTNLPWDQCADDIPYNRYYWRVKARDAVTGRESAWSVVDGFNATSADPYGC